MKAIWKGNKKKNGTKQTLKEMKGKKMRVGN